MPLAIGAVQVDTGGNEQPHHTFAAVGRRTVAHCGTKFIGVVHVGALTDQQLHQTHALAVLGRQLQRCCAGLVARIDIDAALNQRAHYRNVARIRRSVTCRPAALVCAVHVGACRQQRPEHLGIGIGCGPMQRRDAVEVAHTDTRAGLKQERSESLVRVTGGQVQRCRTPPVDDMDVGAGLDQRRQHALVAIFGGAVTRRGTIIVVSLVDVDTGRNQQLDQLVVGVVGSNDRTATPRWRRQADTRFEQRLQLALVATCTRSTHNSAPCTRGRDCH